MPTIHYSRAPVLGLAAVLSLNLVALMAIHAPGDPVAVAPEVFSWDETSGYGAVEAMRAGSAALPQARDAMPSLVAADIRWVPAHTITPSPSVASIRLAIRQQALLSGDRGRMMELQIQRAMTAAAINHDEANGYGAVEATRARPVRRAGR
jgi:hypothetical protein